MQRIAFVAIMASAPVLSAGFAQAATYNTLDGSAPLVIGHRGAPAYLPENTIGGNELAAKMGSDYIETDVMMTKDGVLVAMHDYSLARTTNVEAVYAPRNGGYEVKDFTYAELRSLTVEPTGSGQWTYPGFSPSVDGPYRIPTFAAMLDALTEYNAENGTKVGMLTEGKYGYDAATNKAVIEMLIEKGYDTPEESLVQSFDFGNVSDYAKLLEEHGVEMGVAQLGGGSQVNGEWTVSQVESFLTLAGYTDTVALSYGSITEDLIAAAHNLGLTVYGWTFRPADLEQAYAQAKSFLDWGLDGFITDNPDYLRTVVDNYGSVAPVPVPAALPMLGAGIAALAGIGRLRRRKGA